MLENTVCEVDFNRPKGDTGLQFSGITSNVSKNHQWLNRATSNNILMVYKGQTKGQFDYFKLHNLQKTVTAEITQFYVAINIMSGKA